MNFPTDLIIFRPDDVDLKKSPLRKSLRAETYVLGAFNPGLAKLPTGNLIMMVRVAEALTQPIVADKIHAIRWEPGTQYVLDAYPVAEVNASDPRKFDLESHGFKVIALTSLSWLLPVELNAQGTKIMHIHYDKAIEPTKTYQEYGIEDPRITKIDGTYYMTTCSVSAERHSTTLYISKDGLNYQLQGIVLDHQNKDMLFFEGKINHQFYALTRPLGEVYFAYSPHSPYNAGPSINLARSPDALHWKPADEPFIRSRKGSLATMKVGGGAQPILTKQGWLVLYHGVEQSGLVGIYRTFWALLDANDPTRILRLEDQTPVLEARPELTSDIADQIYLTNVVFTTGIVELGDDFIVASGELDLACRITHIPKAFFE